MVNLKNRNILIFAIGAIFLFAPILFTQGQLAQSSILICNLLVIFSSLYFYQLKDRINEFVCTPVFNKAVLLQVVVQLIIFCYWGIYNPAVYDRFPLIAHQVVFAYFLQFCLAIHYKKKFSISYSNVAAILSTNLFVWFDPKVYFLHLVLIYLALLAKMFITREINGIRTHVFNPSGFVSFLAMIGISLAWFTPGFHIGEYVYAPQIGAFWLWLPHFDFVVFVASCLSLWTPNFYLIPISCISFLVGSNILSRFFMGMDFTETLGKGTVLVGITLLVTDPSTAPKTKLGQILYGVAYAVSLAIAFPILAYLRWDQYYKKVVFIWLVNFLAPYFDLCALWIEEKIIFLKWIEVYLTQKRLLLAYIVFFAIALNFVERATNPPFLMDITQEYKIKPRLMEIVSKEIQFSDEDKGNNSLSDRIFYSLSNGHAADGSSRLSFTPFGDPLLFSAFYSNRRFEDLYGNNRYSPATPFAPNKNFERCW